MLFAISGVNWLAVALATLASSILGGVWFTVLFGKLYANSLGRNHSAGEKPAPLFIYGPLACSLFTTVTTALLLQALHPSNAFAALTLGLLVGLGYVVTTMVNTAINPNFPRPFLYSAVCGPYFLIATVMGTLILYVMG